MATTPVWEIQQSLNVLAFGSFPPPDGLGARDSQAAANAWAGTTGLELLAALNYKNGVTSPGPTWQDFNAVCCSLAGIAGSGAEGQNALSKLAGGGYDT